MSAVRMSIFNVLGKCVTKNQEKFLFRAQCNYLLSVKRNLVSVPLEYDNKDPAPLFFSPNVQKLLRYVTRPDVNKVFRKRNNKGNKQLETPEYKFMTDAELKEELDKAEAKANTLLQIPPIIKVHGQSEPLIISSEPALSGHDNSKFIFTDITYGLKKPERLVTVREPDGTLHEADHETRKKCLQIFLPMKGRKLLEPAMFYDDTLFSDLLNRKEYEFILDRACIQYEPDEASFQRITNRVYLHVDENKAYNILRSTRHFGSMAFYLAWNNMIDNLLLDMIQNSYIREAVVLINLQRSIHTDMVQVDDTKPIADKILALQKPLTDQSKHKETQGDIDLDEKCVECVEMYISNNSSKKAVQELALAAYKDSFRNKLLLQKEIKTLHGVQ